MSVFLCPHITRQVGSHEQANPSHLDGGPLQNNMSRSHSRFDAGEDLPAPLSVHGVPSDLVQVEQRLDDLGSQRVVRGLVRRGRFHENTDMHAEVEVGQLQQAIFEGIAEGQGWGRLWLRTALLLARTEQEHHTIASGHTVQQGCARQAGRHDSPFVQAPALLGPGTPRTPG